MKRRYVASFALLGLLFVSNVLPFVETLPKVYADIDHKESQESKAEPTPTWPVSASKYNPDGLCLLQEAYKRSLSVSERTSTPIDRALLLGLAQIVQFVENDAHFDTLFVPYIRLLHDVSQYAAKRPLGYLASHLLDRALHRAQWTMDTLFPPHPSEVWRLLSILSMLTERKDSTTPFSLPQQAFWSRQLIEKLKTVQLVSKSSQAKAQPSKAQYTSARAVFAALRALALYRYSPKISGHVVPTTKTSWLLHSRCIPGKHWPEFTTKHNPVPECLLRAANARQTTQTEHALYTGLQWLLRYVEVDHRFDAIYPEYLLFLDAVQKTSPQGPIFAITTRMMNHAIIRAHPHLKDIFESDVQDKWRWLATLPFLQKYPTYQAPQLAWYRSYFPASFVEKDRMSLVEALRHKKTTRVERLLRQVVWQHRLQQAQHLRDSSLPQSVDTVASLLRSVSWTPSHHKHPEHRVRFALALLRATKTISSQPPALRQLRQQLVMFLQKEFVSQKYSRVGTLAPLLVHWLQNHADVARTQHTLTQKTVEQIALQQHADGSWGGNREQDNDPVRFVQPTLHALQALVLWHSLPHLPPQKMSGHSRSTTPQDSSRTAVSPSKAWWLQHPCLQAEKLPPVLVSRHSPAALCLLRKAILQTQDPTERSLLWGMHWMIGHVEKASTLTAVLEHYLALLDHLASSRHHKYVPVLARMLLQDTFRRIKPRLDDIFYPDQDSKFKYLSMLPILLKYHKEPTHYIQFYRKHFPHNDQRPSQKLSFTQVLQQKKYERVGALLLDEYYIERMKHRYQRYAQPLPTSRLPTYLKPLFDFTFPETYLQNEDAYLDQLDLIIQLLRILTEDGNIPPPPEAKPWPKAMSSGERQPPPHPLHTLYGRLKQRLLRDWPVIRNRLRDVEFLAEASTALFWTKSDAVAGAEAVRHLLTLQHRDGSWGKEQKGQDSDAYTAMRPTLAAMRAILSWTPKIQPRTTPSQTPPVSSWPRGDACILPPGIPPAIVSRHNPKVVQMIREAMFRTSSVQERAILAGMHWLVGVVEDDDKFDEGFGDYTTIMSEMAMYGQGTTPGHLAQLLLKNAFQRAVHRLPNIFEKTLADKGDFITVLFMLYKFDIPKGPFIRFYQTYFPPGQPKPHKVPFEEALKKRDYVIMGTHIIDEAFLDIFQKRNPNNPFQLRKSQLPSYIQQMETLPFIYDKSNLEGYSDQNYFITHIVLAINHYGESPYPDTPLTRRIYKYFVDNMATIRFEVKDLDLLGELVYCFKIYGQAQRPDVQEAIQYMLDLQHADGSWGNDDDFAGTLYQVMHPTWAVITGLVDIKPRRITTKPAHAQPTTGSKPAPQANPLPATTKNPKDSRP